MIELNVFKRLMEENDDRLPLLTLDEGRPNPQKADGGKSLPKIQKLPYVFPCTPDYRQFNEFRKVTSYEYKVIIQCI